MTLGIMDLPAEEITGSASVKTVSRLKIIAWGEAPFLLRASSDRDAQAVAQNVCPSAKSLKSGMEVQISDTPRSNETMVAIAVTDSV